MPAAQMVKALAAILLIAIAAIGARAADALRPVPALTAHAIDQTGTLSTPELSALQAQLQALEQARGAQVVVVLVDSTAPEDIAAFANRVGNQWKIGRRGVGDGVLVVVAKNDRRMRIEVAKALEGALPDIAAARIIDTAMKPRFQLGDYAGGLRAAVEQIGARIASEGLPAGPGDGAADSNNAAGAAADGGFDWADLAVFLFFGVLVAGPVLRRLLGGALGSLALGAGAGALAYAVTASVLLAGAAGLLAALYTLLFDGRSGALWHGGGGGTAPGGWGGGGGGSSTRGGGFSSGGGGDFGGGGASGDW